MLTELILFLNFTHKKEPVRALFCYVYFITL